jgi:hypothetical protein
VPHKDYEEGPLGVRRGNSPLTLFVVKPLSTSLSSIIHVSHGMSSLLARLYPYQLTYIAQIEGLNSWMADRSVLLRVKSIVSLRDYVDKWKKKEQSGKVLSV